MYLIKVREFSVKFKKLKYKEKNYKNHDSNIFLNKHNFLHLA